MHKILYKAAFGLLIAIMAIWAQSNTTTITGKVASAAGEAIPNAAVSIVNVQTNAAVKVLSTTDGSFTAVGLAPGTYRVEVESPGYKRAEAKEITLHAATPMMVNVVMAAGNAVEAVEFSATPPAGQTDNGEISATVTESRVRQLPVPDRNHQQLIGLQSGITTPVTALPVAVDPQRNRFYSTNGQAPSANLYEMDGLMNIEPFRGTELRIQPNEAVHQVHVSSSNYTEDKGFSGGSVVNTVSMTGTNRLHGSAYEFHSNDHLRARNFFNVANNPDAHLVFNQFGGAIGGPIVKDNTFFFASYEGTYRRGNETVVSTVPVPGAASGNFASIPGLTLYNPFGGSVLGTGRATFLGNQIPSNQINPTSAAIAGFIPAPNQPGFADNLVSNVPLQNDANRFDGRIDHHFNSKTSLFLRYGYTNSRALEGSPLGNVIGAGTRTRDVGQNSMIDVTRIFGASSTAEFRFGYNRYTQKLRMSADETALANAFGASGLSGFNSQLFAVNIPGLAPIGSPSFAPQDGVDNTFNWAITYGMRKSIHDLKAGIDVRRNRTDGFANPIFGANGAAFFGPGATMLNGGPALSPYGQFYNSFAAFLLGQPSQFGFTNFVATPAIRQTQYGAWIGDHLNINSRLSLDIGIRYEFYDPLQPRNPGGAAYYDTSTNSLNFAGTGSFPMELYHHDGDNWAPRFGFAYSPTHKTVIRGGYGISYFQTPYNQSAFMAPVTGAAVGAAGTFSVANLPAPFNPTLINQFTVIPASAATQNGASAGNLPVSFSQRHLETPYVQSYSFQVQQDFYAGTLLSVAYVGTLGRHLPYYRETNSALPGTGLAGLPFSVFGRGATTLFYDNALNNNYNSLQASLTRRFAHGLSFLGSYTWGKALDYTTNNGLLLNPRDLRSNYGPADYDRRHVLSISHMWELPFGRHGGSLVSTLLGGWQWNGILTWQTGTPLTIVTDPVSCACPGNVVLAGLNAGAQPYLNNGSFFFNPAAFTVPTGATIGNLGRGALRGPDMTNYNVSLFKHFHVQEKFDLELRGEAYNITNSTHFANPVTNINAADFGRIVSTANGAGNRQLNVGVRAIF